MFGKLFDWSRATDSVQSQLHILKMQPNREVYRVPMVRVSAILGYSVMARRAWQLLIFDCPIPHRYTPAVHSIIA